MTISHGPTDLMHLLEQQTWMEHVAIIELGNKAQGITLTVATSTLQKIEELPFVSVKKSTLIVL